MTSWTPNDTSEYLRLNPLPADFVWLNNKHQPATVKPTYNVADYGKWLRETPYFPGLFELIHDILFSKGNHLPDIGALATELVRIHKERTGQMKLF